MAEKNLMTLWKDRDFLKYFMSDYLLKRRELKNGSPKPKTNGIAKVSPKRKELNKEYSKVSKPLWKDKDCKVKSKVCTGKAQGCHHLQGKENKEKLLDTRRMIPSCNACNTWIEDNHEEAVKLGLKLKRNTQTIKQPIIKKL